MDMEYELQNNEIRVLEVEDSVRYLVDYIGLEKDMNVQDVSTWLEERENWNAEKAKEILWMYDDDTDMGIGFVNSPKENLPVGIYFKHPRWAEGSICRANNQADLEFFLHIATQLRRSEESNN